MRYTTLLFDLDGTLTDPYEGITRCVQYALAKQGIDVADRRDLRGFIGPPLKAAFVDFHHMSEAAASRAVDDYRERFAQLGMFENRLYDGIVELLSALRASGRQLFVATSKPWFFARKIIHHFELDDYFGKVYGSELDGKRAEKSALIAYILREQKLRPDETLMIGDRHFDLLGAQHNGVPCAAVGYGYGSTAELLNASPNFFFETPGEMARCLLSDTRLTEVSPQYGGVLR
ncbi:HAD family hydrolase [Salinisphaera sp. SPP-AMP-43]|uniref:HAD family hydrolase n=1 Tax=Salinisphaera sp. SPP-AMP-43 TaxID=3121288 RepID=UPI003C6E35C3